MIFPLPQPLCTFSHVYQGGETEEIGQKQNHVQLTNKCKNKLLKSKLFRKFERGCMPDLSQ